MVSALNPLQIESLFKQQAPGPLYLITGEEDLLRDHALAVLKTVVLGDDGGFNYDQFYGDETDGATVRNCASIMPVFADRRLVVVKAAEKLSAKESEPLLDYVKDPSQTTTLVFVSSKLDGRLKFSQALSRTAVTIDCSPFREAQLTPWMAREAQRLGVKLEESAVQLLKDVSGGSLYGVQRELEKLASYVPPDRSATAADVLLLRGIEPGASVFDLTLAIAGGNRGRAFSILARNLEAGEAPLRILGSLVWQYRRIWKVKELMAGGGREGEAARTLRMDPMKIRSFLGGFSEAHLHAALQLFLEADGKLKGGSSGQPKMVMERLLLQLCGYAQGPKPGAPSRPPAPTGRGPARVVSNVRTIKRGN
jgi:DNA polymerase III subunit delta